MAQSRLQQIFSHFRLPTKKLSVVQGSRDPPLWETTLKDFIEQQAAKYGDREAVVCSWTGARLSYAELNRRSKIVAKALLGLGVRPGDTVAIMAGNCQQYVEVFFATTRIGAILVLVNNTYTRPEFEYAINHTEPKVLFISHTIGAKNNDDIIELFRNKTTRKAFPNLQQIILLKETPRINPECMKYYEDALEKFQVSDYELGQVDGHFPPDTVCNLQFTSGTTGNPKAAMLTHYGLLNNGRFIGDNMELTEEDRLCSPPPIFHIFCLVLGMLACLTHGSCFIMPSEAFNAQEVLETVANERCTALHGVPTMFLAELRLPKPENFGDARLRTGIAAGSPVPPQLIKDVEREFKIRHLLNNYGMTETSPTSFMTAIKDPLDKRGSTVGRVLPHTAAKIVDSKGNIVPIGQRGELCVTGYCLQKGYWKNKQKTDEVMIRDENGTLWMYTGDEAVFDEDGYCHITGRIKDLIIRGGENIFPVEIENRLAQHPAIYSAVVVGIKDDRYGEVVGAFLEQKANTKRPSTDEVRSWVRERLARQKVPRYVFWCGDDGVEKTFPITGNGKIKKNLVKEWGNSLAARGLGR